MSKRSRKAAQRQQRNAEQQDTRLPTRRPTSSYVKRLMMEYHEKHIAPLAADVKVSSTLFGALMRLMLDKGVVTEQELAQKLQGGDVPSHGNVLNSQEERGRDSSRLSSTPAPEAP